ncbi:hypothetical protein ACFQU7_22040 [Pseudoroseomonas wenyumeiae]
MKAPRWPQYMAYFEPTTLLSGLAALTEKIGLVATATTSFNEPYNLARRYASTHQRRPRGWNVVTSSNKAEPFNWAGQAAGAWRPLRPRPRIRRGGEGPLG